jgi:hypothetical protein
MRLSPHPIALPANRRSAAFVLLFLLLIYTSNYVDRHLAAGLAEPIKQEFGLSDSFLGLPSRPGLRNPVYGRGRPAG